ncbi:LemA family protein [Georgenia sp. TF02-10]|uniref:LemA family protein n=1 Tax=Georgenia sp. TF02-10 TaxID=2917725 RepID=UPI001FA7CB31|nr:LemA family protein [Georgenia sp. TF02-10]UNX54601.1 LemA family protein [Georgenia sp. TF02-10]
MDELALVLLVVGVAVVVVLGWAVLTYSRLVKLRNAVVEAWAQLEVELGHRHDLVPSLVAAVRAHLQDPTVTDVLAGVTRAGDDAAAPGAGPARQAQQENVLTAALGRLFAVAARHPDLVADEEFCALQEDLTDTEDRIGAGRRFYNARVRELNARVEAFPAALVAAVTSSHRAEYFTAADPAVRTAPAVTFRGRGARQPVGDGAP